MTLLDRILEYLPVAKQRFRGVVLVSVLFFTCSAGFIVFGPIFILVHVFRLSTTHWVIDTIVSTWFALAVAMFELFIGVKVVVKGDVTKMNKHSCSLIVMNHRTRLDWLFLFSLQARYASLKRFKISLKEGLKGIPGAGWAMQAANFLFLKRSWDIDRERIEHSLKQFEGYDYHPQLLLFPEGTDLQPVSREKSRQYAKKNDLPNYEYVLHPRTTGFASVVTYMKEHNDLDQVCDVTISYPQNILQRETDVIYGDIPREVVFTVNCFSLNEIPTGSDPQLARWLEERWAVKEAYLKTFYEGEENIVEAGNGFSEGQNAEVERDLWLYSIATIFFWFIVCSITICLLIYSQMFRWFFLVSAVFYTVINSSIGIDKLFELISAH